MSSERHSGYSDCSQPNSGLSVIGGIGPREVLEQVVVRVDEARGDEAVGGVEHAWQPRGGRPSPTPLTSPSVTATHPPSISRRSASTVATQRALTTTTSAMLGDSCQVRRRASRPRLGEDRCDVVDRGARVDDADAQDDLALPGGGHHECRDRRRVRHRSMPGSRRESSRCAGTPRSTARAPSATRCTGRCSIRRAASSAVRSVDLDGLGVGVGAVRGEAEPERQATGAPRQVVGVVARVPRLVARVVEHVEVLGVLRVGAVGRCSGRGRSAHTSRTGRTATCEGRR